MDRNKEARWQDVPQWWHTHTHTHIHYNQIELAKRSSETPAMAGWLVFTN